MECKKIFDRIDELEKEYIDFLMDICSIESPSDCKKGIDRVGDYIAEKARALGWHIERQKQEISGDCICITMNQHAKERAVCLSGHMDTVHPIGLFGNPPVRMDGEKLYGPGAMDCKGGIAAAFLAMRALYDCGFTRRPVKLILQSDEEVSSRTSNKSTVDFMAEKAKDCVAFLNCEGHSPGHATIARKGISRYVFEVTGKAVHSGACYTGASAIHEAAQKIIALEKYKNPSGITCNCGTISGGTADNSVPAGCTFTVDVRFATKEEMEEADNIVNEISEQSFVPGTKCRVSLKSRRVSMEKTEKNVLLLQKMNTIFAENNLPILEGISSNGGSDASDISSKGIPCVDSLGLEGANIHSKDEYVYVKSIAQSAKRLSSVAYCI